MLQLHLEWSTILLPTELLLILEGRWLYGTRGVNARQEEWRHQRKYFPRYWPLMRGIDLSQVVPLTKPVMGSFGVSLRLNKRMSKQSRRRWFKTPWFVTHCSWAYIELTFYRFLKFLQGPLLQTWIPYHVQNQSYNGPVSETMCISLSQTPHTLFYSLNNQILRKVNQAKYLRVTLSNELSWCPHLSNTASKVHSSLSFLRQGCSAPPVNSKRYKG